MSLWIPPWAHSQVCSLDSQPHVWICNLLMIPPHFFYFLLNAHLCIWRTCRIKGSVSVNSTDIEFTWTEYAFLFVSLLNWESCCLGPTRAAVKRKKKKSERKLNIQQLKVKKQREAEKQVLSNYLFSSDKKEINSCHVDALFLAELQQHLSDRSTLLQTHTAARAIWERHCARPARPYFVPFPCGALLLEPTHKAQN